MPDRPELWYLYGDILFHEGQAIGVKGWTERAIAAFQRARAMAPDHIESDYHLMQLALASADTTLFRDVAASLLRRDTVNEMHAFIHGLTALHEDTPAAWSRYGALVEAGTMQMLSSVRGQALVMARGIDELVEIGRTIERRAVTPAEASTAYGIQLQLLANSGRPGTAVQAAERELRRRGPSQRAEHLQLAAWIGLAWDGDTVAGRAAVEELRQLLEDQVRTSGSAPPHPILVCKSSSS